MGNLSNTFGVSPISKKAGGTIAINRAVKLDTTVDQVVAASAIADVVIGASLQSAASGESVSLQSYGEAKMEVGTGGVTLHAQVMVIAGEAGKIGTAAGATAKSIGMALDAGNSGEIVRVLLNVPNVNGPANT